jgi:hypothetical protein
MKHRQILLLVPLVALLSISAAVPAWSELRIGGFTDFAFYATNDSSKSSRSGFTEGQFVLHVNSALGDRLSFFAEITWTPRSTGFGTEIERTILKYSYRDAFMPSVGRYHTPISWWNVAFHHGTWLQTTVDRPVAVRFGSTFIPIHFVGAMAEGRFFPGAVTVSYAAGVGNGRAENPARGGDAGDIDSHRATLLQLGLKHDALYGLEVGGAAYLDRYPVPDSASVPEQIYSAYVALTRENPEILAEVFLVRHEDEVAGRDANNFSYYVQVAYRLPQLGGILKPYARIEEIDIDDDPLFMETESDLRRILAGLRIDFASMAAIKLEGRRFKAGQRAYVEEFYAAVNVVF